MNFADSDLVSSRTAAEDALSGVTMDSHGNWLPRTSPYAAKGTFKLQRDMNQGNGSKAAQAAYIASSSFVHCADAWSYLGRAIDAVLRGDLNVATHLTYYAELRSAKSILASEGIFIGSRYNAMLVSPAGHQFISADPTHDAVWKVLDIWSVQPSAVGIIGRVVAPGGADLTTWVGPLPAGVGPVVKDLLDSVAFDLKSFSTDHRRRDVVSYDPTSILPTPVSIDSIRNPVGRFWISVEPVVGGDFPVIDQQILARILRTQYESTHTVAAPTPIDFTREVVHWNAWEGWVDSLTPNALKGTALHSAIRVSPMTPGFKAVEGDAFDFDPSHQLPAEFLPSMIARATLLLRLSTGMCRRLLDDSGKDVSQIAAWVEWLAHSRGVCGVSGLPDPVVDLFADLEGPRIDLEASSATDPWGLSSDLGAGTVLLGQTERVFAWSLS